MRTLAYVVTECHEDATSASYNQRLEILQGDGPPVTVMEIPTFRSPPVGLCSTFAALRFGANSVFAGAFQRLAVSPDGSGVVFELTFDFSLLAQPGVRSPLTPDQEGIFFVRTDGSGGLRPLGPASREAAQRLLFDSSGAINSAYAFPFFAFSPDGKKITFMDRGPDPAGEDAPQVIVLDIATGTRAQVTHLPDAAPDPLFQALPATTYPAFTDDDTVQFVSRANPNDLNPEGTERLFTVKTDGTGLTALPAPVALSGSQIVPVFSITRPVTSNNVIALAVQGTPVNRSSYYTAPAYNVIYELFIVSPDHVLQLTNFRRIDTGGQVGGVTTYGQRVFFQASADPLGTNPSENCQIFSMDALAGDLRQLTRFRAADHSSIGCLGGPVPPESGCLIAGGPIIDPQAQTLIFDSTCDPLGTNPDGGQFFAMRPDGTGLRQLTATRGVVMGVDGSIDVQLPGPAAYPAQLGIF